MTIPFLCSFHKLEAIYYGRYWEKTKEITATDLDCTEAIGLFGTERPMEERLLTEKILPIRAVQKWRFTALQ